MQQLDAVSTPGMRRAERKDDRCFLLVGTPRIYGHFVNLEEINPPPQLTSWSAKMDDRYYDIAAASEWFDLEHKRPEVLMHRRSVEQTLQEIITEENSAYQLGSLTEVRPHPR